MASAQPKTNLLGLTRAELEAFVEGMGEKSFRARQLLKWLYKRNVSDFDEMTDLAKSFRAKLKDVAEVRVPQITLTQVSADGTRKWLLAMDGVNGADGAQPALQAIEMVFIPEPDRGTLCISSQVGCAMDCSFCSTAQQGFNRNLTAAEIASSRTSCSWAWASRSRTIATSCRPLRSSWTISASIFLVAASP
jgi:23S rRNA (adenine2503-C2)-methyltransferase